MKRISTNQEILLIPRSNFFQRDWCELNTNKDSKKLSQKEQLIQLCWNGMLKEMIPEICEPEPGKKPLVLWEISESDNLLGLRYGDFDQQMNDEWSINPHMVLALAEMN